MISQTEKISERNKIKRTSPLKPERSSTPSPQIRERSPNRTPVQKNSRSLDRLFLFQRGELSFDQMTNFRGGPKRKGHQLIVWSFLAVVIDALILLSASSVFVLIFKVIAMADSNQLLTSARQLNVIQFLIGAWLTGAWIYMILTRVFFGFSIGEWACDLRLGQPTERMKIKYSAQVFTRTTLIFFSGLFTIPILSLIVGSDIAGKITKTNLYSLK